MKNIYNKHHCNLFRNNKNNGNNNGAPSPIPDTISISKKTPFWLAINTLLEQIDKALHNKHSQEINFKP
jgi:hypothetical protein